MIQVTIYYGSPFHVIYFYDTKANLLSQVYDCPVLVNDGKIVLIENSKLIITDIFDKDKYYKEIERNFTQTVPPSSAIISATFTNKDTLKIEYYEGENYTEKSEVINLDEK